MKIPKPILERRRSVRIPENIVFHIGHENHDAQALMVNLSTHGTLCLVERDIPMMTQLQIVLSLPGSSNASKEKSLRLRGVVVRKEIDAASGKYLIAIFFQSLKPTDKKALERFIHSRLNG